MFWLFYFLIGYLHFWLAITAGLESVSDVKHPRVAFTFMCLVWAIFVWPVPFAVAIVMELRDREKGRTIWSLVR